MSPYNTCVVFKNILINSVKYNGVLITLCFAGLHIMHYSAISWIIKIALFDFLGLSLYKSIKTDENYSKLNKSYSR